MYYKRFKGFPIKYFVVFSICFLIAGNECPRIKRKNANKEMKFLFASFRIIRGQNPLGFAPVIRSLFRNYHVVDVRFAKAGGCDADEFGVCLEIVDRFTAGVAHA